MKIKHIALLLFASVLSMSVFAETDSEASAKTEQEEFPSDEKTEEGFITSYINRAIESGMQNLPAPDGTPSYGRTLTDYASAPKFGGYFIGKYNYTDKPGEPTNGGFSQRMTRLYVDGTILNDFAYRIQLQTANSSFHMKDFFIEWKKYPEFKVKVGQYKRAFGFENPMNPWDVGTGDYAQVTKKLTGHADDNGAESTSNGGRDQGLQFQGDLFPVGSDKHRLIHYQLMVANGQGINTSDANKKKDFLGTIQFQPVKGLCLGLFGWTGDYTAKVSGTNVTMDRDRYMISARYDKDDWTFRAEYAHSTGYKLSDYDTATETFSGKGRADGWYATLGIPCTPWLKVYAKYDVYRDGADWSSTQTIYSIAPNIQLHKNLMFQLQYNITHDRTLTTSRKNYSDIWVETYVRF